MENNYIQYIYTVYIYIYYISTECTLLQGHYKSHKIYGEFISQTIRPVQRVII